MQISVVVHPNSKNPRIEMDLTEMFHIYVKEPPLEGKANEAVREAVANHFKVKKSSVEILSGHKSKLKHIQIIK